MPDYNKCIIYKLCCKDPIITDIYVGSTCNFTRRKYEHKSTCNNNKIRYYNAKVYQFIRENGNWNNWNMIQIEAYPCNDKREKETRERYWIEELNTKLNKNIPTRTSKEYQQLEIAKEKKHEYTANNKNGKTEPICRAIFLKYVNSTIFFVSE